MAADGFYAQAFLNDDGKVIIAFEGTAGPLSPSGAIYSASALMADAQILAGGAPLTYVDAVTYARNVINEAIKQGIAGVGGQNIVLTGHSLGGAEAEVVAAAYGELGASLHGYTFGAPGLAAEARIYQPHGGGAAGKLAAHGKYLERDGAGAEGQPGQFYDRDDDKLDAYPRLEEWAEEDKRHIRIMLAPESGARIEDLKDFTRATLAQMERDVGAPLEWVAVNHHNTDNPHVHVILRGRRADGPDLLISRAYATSGLRHAAREVATQILGERSRDDERLSLERETRAERFTRLDRILETEIDPSRAQRIQSIGRRLEPALRAALRNRVRELSRLGLAQEDRRDRFRFEPDWASRLEDIGRGIDIRRRLGRELEPGKGKLKLYAAEMGRVAGEVLEAGRRGEEGKGYVIVRDKFLRPILANVRYRESEGLAPGAIVAIEPKAHTGHGARVKLERLSEMPIACQIEARAETELDREIVQILGGASQRLPNSRELRNAISSRLAWHQRERSGARDLTGRFEF